MKKTEVLGLPIYDRPEEDLFKFQDWNEGNQKIDNKIKEFGTSLEQKAIIEETLNVNNSSKKTMIENYKQAIATNKTNNILTISTFNIRSMHDKKSIPIKKALYEIYKTNSNICCIQEFLTSIEWDSIGLLKTSEFIELYFAQMTNVGGGNYGVGIMSNEVLSSKTLKKYTMDSTYEQRGYEKVEITYNNKKISVYNTHLSYETETLITSQVQELKVALDSDVNSYKIVCGDFNTDNLIYLQPLGLTITNNGEFKTFKPTLKAIDNILITSNLNVKSKKMTAVSDEISDHNMLTVELEVV